MFKRSSSVVVDQNISVTKLNEDISNNKQMENCESTFMNSRNNSEMRNHIFNLKGKISPSKEFTCYHSRNKTTNEVNSFVNIQVKQNTIIAVSPTKLQTSKKLLHMNFAENKESHN